MCLPRFQLRIDPQSPTESLSSCAGLLRYGLYSWDAHPGYLQQLCRICCALIEALTWMSVLQLLFFSLIAVLLGQKWGIQYLMPGI